MLSTPVIFTCFYMFSACFDVFLNMLRTCKFLIWFVYLDWRERGPLWPGRGRSDPRSGRGRHPRHHLSTTRDLSTMGPRGQTTRNDGLQAYYRRDKVENLPQISLQRDTLRER